MSVDYRVVENVIQSKWNECSGAKLDDCTLGYVNGFLSEYYDKVRRGLLDSGLDAEVRDGLFEELVSAVGESRVLHDLVSGCMVDTESFDEAKSNLINAVFKLQSCSGTRW